jgi:AraC-like DNA-binding protein
VSAGGPAPTSRWVRRPPPALAALLAQPRVGFARHGATHERILERAHPALTLMVGLEGTLWADGIPLPAAWAAGLTDHYEVVDLPGRQAMLDVKLSPLGAYRVFGRPLHELAGRVVSLEELFGLDGRRLHERLGEQADWGGRFQAMEAFLLARVARGPRPSPLAQRAFAELVGRSGDVRVGELAGELGCSRRHLHACLSEQAGVGPKTLARLLRFDAARRRLASGRRRPAEVAAACGYYDESHLSREFRALAGRTPATPFPFLQDACSAAG